MSYNLPSCARHMVSWIFCLHSVDFALSSADNASFPLGSQVGRNTGWDGLSVKGFRWGLVVLFVR